MDLKLPESGRLEKVKSRVGCLWKSGAKDTAVQTLRECRASANRAERLECGAFTAAFGWGKQFFRQSRNVEFRRRGIPV